ncbi:MAG: GntR family transcriptional regulator, vanillate catabolism transcriptional regulator [bacterium]
MSPFASGAPAAQMARALLGRRELLYSGADPPGQRLSELPLVERLGVSRTPLRLALARLEHEGLIEALPAGGYVVRRFTRADIDDAIELRGVLEGTAARLAAERRPTRRRLGGLRACCDEIAGHVARDERSFDSLVRYTRLNERFHARLVQLAASPVLARAVEGVVALPFAAPSAALVAGQAELPESREILVIAQSQHEALVASIAAGEGSRAEALGREHARLARRNLEVVLRHRELLDRVPDGSAVVHLAAGAEAVRAPAAP